MSKKKVGVGKRQNDRRKRRVMTGQKNHKLQELTRKNGTLERYGPDTWERARSNRATRVLNRQNPLTIGVSCPVKTIEPPGKHRRNRQSRPRKSIENDVPVKEPQFVTMDRHFKLIQELLICPVTPEDFSEEFIPYPREKCKRRDSDTDSKFELRKRFTDLRTGMLEHPAIATVSTGTRVCIRGSSSATGLPSSEDIHQTEGGKEVWPEFYRRTGDCPDGGRSEPRNYGVFRISGLDSGSGRKLQGRNRLHNPPGERKTYFRELEKSGNSGPMSGLNNRRFTRRRVRYAGQRSLMPISRGFLRR
ncbi:hypothetical protein QTP88_016556 [Uroleucon formosanum]